MQISTQARGPVWAHIRAEFRAHRSERATRKALEQDLAGYNTPAEVAELNEILRRHDEGDAAGIRRILDARLAA